jgi:hypothetical protein
MSDLPASVLDELTQTASYIATQTRLYFDQWQRGEVYIAKSALKAMERRYMALVKQETMTVAEGQEFMRLYAWVCLCYPPDGRIPSPTETAIDSLNYLHLGLPIYEDISSGGGGFSP